MRCIVPTGMQEEVAEANKAATPPDPELHMREVTELEAACRESRSRIASLEIESRCVSGERSPLSCRAQRWMQRLARCGLLHPVLKGSRRWP